MMKDILQLTTGYSHNNSTLYKNKENFINEIKNTDIEISKALDIPNYSSHIFRFPNGFSSAQFKKQKKEAVNTLYELGYAYIDWNALNKDSENFYTKDQLLKNLKNSTKNKKALVILMHDTLDVSDSSSVLEDSISYLKAQGYVFKNLYDEKIGKP